jgi:hypothetical protein
LAAQVAGRIGPQWVSEDEALIEEPSRKHTTAFQDEFCLGSQEDGAHRQHPLRGGETDGRAPRFAEVPHELSVWHRIRRSDVDSALDILVVDEPADRPDEVFVMNPRDELSPIPCASAESVSQEAVILWWLLDKSPRQRATTALVSLFRQVLPSAALTLRLPPIRKFVQSADDLFREALFEDAARGVADVSHR